ncbi:unnamed protein product [Pleuronectes platessa]|uniref:DH domain-containing protein n=1 Tax=Pleuronectes platessa TaxID=8262 RepID=A0A9N7URX1_PLEPL|nr:unnamed protein product [Pleuronectes platessa]
MAFLHRIRQTADDQQCLSPEHVKILFSNIEDILELHKEVLSAVEASLKPEPQPQHSLGYVFLQFRQSFLVYGERTAGNHEKAYELPHGAEQDPQHHDLLLCFSTAAPYFDTQTMAPDNDLRMATGPERDLNNESSADPGPAQLWTSTHRQRIGERARRSGRAQGHPFISFSAECWTAHMTGREMSSKSPSTQHTEPSCFQSLWVQKINALEAKHSSGERHKCNGLRSLGQSRSNGHGCASSHHELAGPGRSMIAL